MLEEKLFELILQDYKISDFPCLFDQYQRFKILRPFMGLRILSATPIYKNYLSKILPLLSGGADIVITSPKFIKSSEEVISQLVSVGLVYQECINLNENFDFVLDCGGEHSSVIANGYVELTKSGEDKYINSGKKFINVDNSNCKIIEDRYGTSDGFIRAMAKLGFSSFNGKKFLIVGLGKVGSGVFEVLLKKGALVKFVDPMVHFPETLKIHSFQEIVDFDPSFVITATGVKSVIEKCGLVPILKNLNANFINLGVEDEYGDSFLPSEVLNDKIPLNFILEEPTKLMYLDPTFALHNECLYELLLSKDSHISNKPPKHMDDYMSDLFNRNLK